MLQEFTPLHLQAQVAANSVKAALTRIAADMGGHDTERAMLESASELGEAVDALPGWIEYAISSGGLEAYAKEDPLSSVRDAALRTMDKLDELESVNRGADSIQSARDALGRLGELLNDDTMINDVLLKAVGESV